MEEFDAAIRELSSSSLATTTVNLVIDRDGVEKAKADLDRTTELMATEESETPVVRMESPEPERPSGDPWEEFSARLDDDQKAYLRMVLEGEVSSPSIHMEGAINAVAMETVNDPVIEDGMPVPDYIEELTAIVRDGERSLP